jgi:HEAT repeat protein
VGKYVAYLALLTLLAVGAVAYVWTTHPPMARPATGGPPRSETAPDWLAELYSQNPHDVQEGTEYVLKLGPAALPAIEEAFRNPATDREHRKAALKACGILGLTAAPVIPAVVSQLGDDDLTEEAAMALSFMGPAAFPPLRDAVGDEDPVVRREALRSLGKLHSRADLPITDVLPHVTDGMLDPDPGVRVVAATYLGILNQTPATSVPLLTDGLDDEDLEVRTACATALGSFGSDARKALPALKKAAADTDPDLAREAGRSMVRISAAGR